MFISLLRFYYFFLLENVFYYDFSIVHIIAYSAFIPFSENRLVKVMSSPSSEIACFACDLKNDPKLISEYIEYHKKVWPEIIDDIRAQGIQNMQIFHVADRLFMIVTTSEKFKEKFGSNKFSWKNSAEMANRNEAVIKKLC